MINDNIMSCENSWNFNSNLWSYKFTNCGTRVKTSWTLWSHRVYFRGDTKNGPCKTAQRR